MKLLFITLLMSSQLMATVFTKIPVQEQIKEADGILVGHFLKQKSLKLEDGMIATQMFFKISREYGLQSDMFGLDEVIVHYPGGTFEGMTSKIDGIPHFIAGEKVAIFTKNIENRYWGLNLGYGTFRVVNYGNQIMLVNSIFPSDGKIGQVKLADFERDVRAIKGVSLKVVQNTPRSAPEADRTPASEGPSGGKNRSLASEAPERENEGGALGQFWLVVFLAFLGGAFRLFRQKT